MSIQSSSIACSHGRGFNCTTCYMPEKQRVARAELAWKASQGNKQAQREYADTLEAEGLKDYAAFYRAKADGKTAAFTLEAFKAGKH